MAEATPGLSLPVRVVADLPIVWRHLCGALNEGSSSHPRTGAAVCGACSQDVRPDDVEARYLLVEVAL